MTTLIVHLDGGAARARACLEALASLHPEPEFEAIVVDDASADLAALLDTLEGDVRAIRNERRLGLAASAAAAANLATTDTLVLLRDAPLLHPDALGPLLTALDDPTAAGAAAAPARLERAAGGEPAQPKGTTGGDELERAAGGGVPEQVDGTAGASASPVPTPATPAPGAAETRALPHPVHTHALALRRADAGALAGAAGPAGGDLVGQGSASAALELAAICANLARRGRVETVAASVAGPPGARAVSARANPGDAAELTIVIPTLDATSERVRACVAAIQTATDAPHQIVLVDNGAPPQGFTAPVNAGLRAVDTPYAVVMNDDVEPLPGWWAPLRAALDAGAAVSFPLTVEGGMREDFAAWCFALSRRTIEEMSHAPGEFFDPALRVWFQDTDLLQRLRALGRPPRLVRESRIRHALSATVRSEDPALRAWIERTVAADRAAFLRKHPHLKGATA